MDSNRHGTPIDAEPAVERLLERHTPITRRSPDWAQVVKRRSDRKERRIAPRLFAGLAISALVGVLVLIFLALPKESTPDVALPGNADTPDPSSAPGLTVGPDTVTGTDMRLEIPKGWVGRFKLGGDQGGLPIIQAGNFALPASDDDLGGVAQQLLPPGGVYINVIHYSTPLEGSGWPTVRLPVTLTTDALGGYEGVAAPAHGRISALVEGKRFVFDVSFGQSPVSSELLQVANGVLAGFAPI